MSEMKNLPEGWLETTLGEVIERITKGTTPKTFSTDNDDINYIKSDALNYGGILDGSKFVKITVEENEKLKRSQLKLDDVLLSMAGEYLGKTGLVKKEHLPANTNQAVAIITVNKNIIDYLFLWYKLRDLNTVKYFKSIPSQSAQPNINFQEIKTLEIGLPSISEQKSIASILTSFDDKIELLQSQNKTLEQMAQTLFAEWFSNYDKNDDDNLPKGWRVDSLETIAIHSKINIKPLDNPDTEYYHYSLPSYDNGLIPLIEKGEMIKSNKYLVESNSFLVSKLNPFTPRIWTIFDSQQNFICSTEFQVVKPKEDLYFSLIHCFLNSDEFTSEISQKIKGTSSSHQRVNPQDIFDVELVIPSQNDLIKFNYTIFPLIEKKNINRQQIQTLTKTRDELLPRLMNGEVRVKI